MKAHKNPNLEPSEQKRTNQREQFLGGLEATSLGFILLGCIGVGFFAGAWLDSRLNSTMWTPILVVAGAVAGFVEMIRTLMRLSKKAQRTVIKRNSDVVARSAYTKRKGGSLPNTTDSVSRQTAAVEVGQNIDEPQVQSGKPRIFTVPPPPVPSFDRKHNQGTELTSAVIQSKSSKQKDKQSDDSKQDMDLLERYLSDDQSSSQ